MFELCSKYTTSAPYFFTDIMGDYDCAVIYRGEINRLEFNDEVLNILAEDRTQIKISNKTVPYIYT